MSVLNTILGRFHLIFSLFPKIFYFSVIAQKSKILRFNSYIWTNMSHPYINFIFLCIFTCLTNIFFLLDKNKYYRMPKRNRIAAIFLSSIDVFYFQNYYFLWDWQFRQNWFLLGGILTVPCLLFDEQQHNIDWLNMFFENFGKDFVEFFMFLQHDKRTTTILFNQ